MRNYTDNLIDEFLTEQYSSISLLNMNAVGLQKQIIDELAKQLVFYSEVGFNGVDVIATNKIKVTINSYDNFIVEIRVDDLCITPNNELVTNVRILFDTDGTGRYSGFKDWFEVKTDLLPEQFDAADVAEQIISELFTAVEDYNTPNIKFN